MVRLRVVEAIISMLSDNDGISTYIKIKWWWRELDVTR